MKRSGGRIPQTEGIAHGPEPGGTKTMPVSKAETVRGSKLDGSLVDMTGGLGSISLGNQ